MKNQNLCNSGRDHNPTNTRERILAAAAKVLSTKGYSAARLNDIADAAEVRAPAVYYYFDSRDDLIAEVMAVGQQRLREHVETSLAHHSGDGDPMERLCSAVRAHLEVELELSDFATAVTRNIGQLPDDVRHKLRTESVEYIDLWRGLLQDARAADAIRPELDLGAARMLIMGALNWTPEWWNPHHGPLSQVVNTAESVIRNGLGHN